LEVAVLPTAHRNNTVVVTAIFGAIKVKYAYKLFLSGFPIDRIAAHEILTGATNAFFVDI